MSWGGFHVPFLLVGKVDCIKDLALGQHDGSTTLLGRIPPVELPLLLSTGQGHLGDFVNFDQMITLVVGFSKVLLFLWVIHVPALDDLHGFQPLLLCQLIAACFGLFFLAWLRLKGLSIQPNVEKLLIEGFFEVLDHLGIQVQVSSGGIHGNGGFLALHFGENLD